MRSQQINEITEEKSSSEKECNLIQLFDSCDEFEIMMVDAERKKGGKERTGNSDLWTVNSGRNRSGKVNNQEITKIDIRRHPRSHQIKALKALVRTRN